MRVAELMRPDGSWDVDLITSMFGEEDAAAILSIPCGGEGTPDVRRWHFTENGEYSVKSGFCVAMERASTPVASSSDSMAMEKWWTKFWQLRVPPKVKLFCWRVCLGQIPVRAVLARKKITSDDSCPVCQEARETVFHSFWGCRWSMRVWKEAGLGHILPLFRDGDVFDSILRAMETLEVRFHELYITIILEL
jgi:hypothetical protein